MNNRFALASWPTLAVALLALQSAPAAAQVRIALSGGLALPTAKIEFGDDVGARDVGSEVRPSVGAAAALPLTDAFAIQVGAHYTIKGAVGTATLSGVPTEWAHRVGYVEASALARLGTEFGRSGFSGHLLAGPAVARETSCEVKLSATRGPAGDAATLSEGTCDATGLKRSMYDFGVAGGAGVEFMGASGVGLAVGGLYTYGLVDLDQDAESGLWHRTLTFRAGLVFSVG